MNGQIVSMIIRCFALSFLTVVASANLAISNNEDSANSETGTVPALVELKSSIQLVREQLTAMIDHRQQDYNALEESLKRSMEKNTELTVLRNQVRQLRKEVNSLRGSGSANEAKNERLKVKWLASAVTELRAEVAEVLGARNASEEFAERSRMRSELELLRGDVSQVGKGIRDLGGRIARIEASLGTIRLDIFAVKERAGQLTRICADVSSQLSTVQIEMKSFKCPGSSSSESGNGVADTKSDDSERGSGSSNYYNHHHSALRHAGHRMEERLSSLERKISMVSRKRGILEKRVVYESQEDLKRRIVDLEKNEARMEARLANMSKEGEARTARVDESIIRLFESVENVEEKFETNKSEEKRELAKLEVNAAKKYAELSLTREELVNLRRTVQALSVSASKLQEKSDLQRDSITSLKSSIHNATKDLKVAAFAEGLDKSRGITKELERAEDDYRTMIESLPSNCDEHSDGLTMLAPGGQALPLLVSCRRGWIVIGRRIDGTVDFDRKWNEYAEGFGSPLNELWLGNEAIHRLTRDNCTRLGVDLVDIYGNHWRAEYENFRVDSEETGYRLSVSGYTGNATDAFAYQNGMSFSAKDRDMDTSSSDCAANYRGGWWFSHCQHANLNGRYSLGLAWYRADTNQWMAVVSAVMSVQRKQQC